VLHVDRTVRSEVSAAPSRCLAVLAAVEAYPSWCSSIAGVEVLERHPDGAPVRIRLLAQVLGVGVEMECALELASDRVVLRRLPYDAQDDERYVATWAVSPGGGGTLVELHVVAALDAPGAVSLVRGRVTRRLVDDLLADFARWA
jgi:Polyketide cyclase / dehydrase and lipid transport